MYNDFEQIRTKKEKEKYFEYYLEPSTYISFWVTYTRILLKNILKTLLRVLKSRKNGNQDIINSNTLAQ